MSKFDKMIEKKVSDKVETKMPKTNAPKETNMNKSNIKSLTRDEAELASTVLMTKAIREAHGESLTDNDKWDLERAEREMRATKAPTLSSDLLGTLINEAVLDGTFIESLFGRTTIGNIWNLERVEDLADVETINKGDYTFHIVGEGNDSIDSSSSQGKMIHKVHDFMGSTTYSYLANQRSIVDLATKKTTELSRDLMRWYERYYLNGDASATHMDNDIATNGVATDPRKFNKGLRKIASEKATVNFGGANLSDVQIASYLMQMQEAGGDYLDDNQVQEGNVVLFVTQKFYNRLRVMDGFTDASKSGNGSTMAGGKSVASIFGIPVVTATYLPALTSATGVVSATAGDNVNAMGIMFNKEYFKPYYYGDPILEFDSQKRSKVNEIFLSQKLGFNGKFDRADDASTVDTDRVTAVLGRNINPTIA